MSSYISGSDRIRRHMARSTPDVVKRWFPYFGGGNVEDEMAKWANRFGDRMRIKHGDRIRIDIGVSQNLWSYPYPEEGFIVYARVIHTM